MNDKEKTKHEVVMDKSEQLVAKDNKEITQNKSPVRDMKNDFKCLVLLQALQTNFRGDSKDNKVDGTYATVAALALISPKDAIEDMLVTTQMIGLHNAAMECIRRAAIPEQHFEFQKEYMNQANKLTRSYAVLVETLNRHRGKGTEQKMAIEHIHVHNGGKAIIGNVLIGGGGSKCKKLYLIPCNRIITRQSLS